LTLPPDLRLPTLLDGSVLAQAVNAIPGAQLQARHGRVARKPLCGQADNCDRERAMLKSERQDKIAQEVLRRGAVSVSDLAAELGVSEITVRRDLDELSDVGRLQRVRGGARQPSPRGPELPVVHRESTQKAEKRAIALAAIQLIIDGDVIALESGSTTLELARVIAVQMWQHLQVITNSFSILNELMRVPGIQLVFVGGFVNPNELGTFGTLAEDMLKRMNIQKMFLGCRGLDPKTGLSSDIQAEMEIATVRAFVAASNWVVVLADHTKFGRAFSLQMLPITEVDLIVTDDIAPKGVLKDLYQDKRVIVASLDSTAQVQGASTETV